jgi:hypothetical protein
VPSAARGALRTVKIAIALLVGLAAIGPTLSAQPSRVAAQTLEYLRDEFHLDVWMLPSGRDLCIGEDVQFKIFVSRWAVYQTPQGPRQVPRRLPPRFKELVSTDVNVQYDASILHDVVTVADMEVDTLQAAKVGTSPVVFTVTPPFGGSISKTLTVNVRNCDYRAITMSVWYLEAEVKVMAVSTINTILTAQPPNGRHVEIKNPMAESHNITYVFPRGGCPATETVSHFNSPVIGDLNLDSGQFPVTINYGSVTAGTDVSCGGVSGHNAGLDQGTPDPLTFDMTAQGGSKQENHVLRAPGLGDYTGETHLILTPIPR